MKIDESQLANFEVRVIVAGSRNYNDYESFSNTISGFVSSLGDKSIVFISGKAATGADALVIDWCKEHSYPWIEYPADWDNIDIPGAVIRINRFKKSYNAVAGHMRNATMAKAGTHLVAFWDGVSSGTKNMLSLGEKHKLITTVHLVEKVKNTEFTFFHGKDNPLSQWYPCKFTVKGIEFNCAEQFMMYCKAMLFGDRMIANLVIVSNDPKEQKQFGRDIVNYVESVWKAKREHYVYIGNLNKYQQNPDLLKFLLNTEGTELVEASKSDTIWGVGLAASDPRILDRRNWRGLNLLGKTLTRVRDHLSK